LRLAQEGQPGGTSLDLDDDQCEAAAHRVASQILHDHPIQALLPERTAKIRMWEEEGHYYTVYFLALAAGFDGPIAEELAFYAQMADEVLELDAFNSGVDFYSTAGAVPFIGPAHVRALTRGNLEEIWESGRQIQVGLHCLTGRNGKKESALRKRILEEISPSEKPALRFGLALHAFDDSYAHR
jgi:hypothetical protein